MLNKHTPLTQITTLAILALLIAVLAACGADNAASETSRQFAPVQNAESIPPAEADASTALPAASLRFARAAQPNALEVWVDDVSNLYAVDLEIRFDPAEAQLADADAEQDGIQLQAGQTPAPDFIANNSGDNQAGVARYVVTQVAPREGFSGSGLVATLLWEGSVDPAAVSFGAVTLVNQDGQSIEAAIQNAGQDAVSMNAEK